MDMKEKLPLKSIPDYIKEYKKGIFLPQKAFTINFNRKNICFDDVFLLEKNREIKVSKIEITFIPNGYVKGIQFTYKTLSDKKEIKGNNMTTYKGKSKIQKTVFDLKDDEFIIEIFGRKGAIIDNIGFKTNLGRSLSGGGNGGGPFSIKCIKDYYFSVFAGSCGDCDDSLSNLTVDILTLPNVIIKKEIDFKMSTRSKNVLRLAMDFLSISECMKLFLVNKEFSKLRFDHYILGNFWTRIVYAGNNQNRRYIKEFMKRINDEEILNDLKTLKELLKFSKNKISDPYGKFNFKGWLVEGDWNVDKSMTQRFRNSCFTTSYTRSSLLFKEELTKLFDNEQIRLLNEGLNHILVGSFFGSGWNKTEASFKCRIYDKQDKILFENHYYKNYDDTCEHEHITFKYKNIKGSIAYRIELIIEGRDNKFWGGYFGPSISGTYIRILPNDEYFEKFYLESNSNKFIK